MSANRPSRPTRSSQPPKNAKPAAAEAPRMPIRPTGDSSQSKSSQPPIKQQQNRRRQRPSQPGGNADRPPPPPYGLQSFLERGGRHNAAPGVLLLSVHSFRSQFQYEYSGFCTLALRSRKRLFIIQPSSFILPLPTPLPTSGAIPRRIPRAKIRRANTHQRSQAMLCVVRAGRVRSRCSSNCLASTFKSLPENSSPPLCVGDHPHDFRLGFARRAVPADCRGRRTRPRPKRRSPARRRRWPCNALPASRPKAEPILPRSAAGDGRQRGAVSPSVPPVSSTSGTFPLIRSSRTSSMAVAVSSVEKVVVSVRKASCCDGSKPDVGNHPAHEASPERGINVVAVLMRRRQEGPTPHAGPFDDHHAAAADGLIGDDRRGLPPPSAAAASTTASAFGVPGLATVASEGMPASVSSSPLSARQPPQRLPCPGHLHAETRFLRRLPADRQQLPQPLVDLRGRRAAETNQRAFALGKPFFQPRKRGIGKKQLRIAAQAPRSDIGSANRLPPDIFPRPIRSPTRPTRACGGLSRVHSPLPLGEGPGVRAVRLDFCSFFCSLSHHCTAARDTFRLCNRPSASRTTLVSSIDGSAASVRIKYFVSQ